MDNKLVGAREAVDEELVGPHALDAVVGKSVVEEGLI